MCLGPPANQARAHPQLVPATLQLTIHNAEGFLYYDMNINLCYDDTTRFHKYVENNKEFPWYP